MDPEQTLVSPPPFVEVELVYEKGRPGLTGLGWCALQLWTLNHIYDVEWSMRCFCVTDRESGQPLPGHAMLDALLTGGQRKGHEGFELTFPVPRPGVTAVFEKRHGERTEYITTSEVTRVILRLRVMSVAEESSEPSWKEISGSFRDALGITRPGHEG